MKLRAGFSSRSCGSLALGDLIAITFLDPPNAPRRENSGSCELAFLSEQRRGVQESLVL
jgi:hypothetical protein